MLKYIATIVASIGAFIFYLYTTGLITSYILNLTHKERRNANDPDREEYIRETHYSESISDCVRVGFIANIPIIIIILIW